VTNDFFFLCGGGGILVGAWLKWRVWNAERKEKRREGTNQQAQQWKAGGNW
jgi:hypothetical protein